MFIYTICCRHHRKWVEIRLRYTLQRNILISMKFLAKHMHGNFLLCLYLYMWRFYVSIFFSDGQQVYVFYGFWKGTLYREPCIIIILTLKWHYFLYMTSSRCRTRKEIVTSVCSHGDVRMVHNLLIVEPCCVH